MCVFSIISLGLHNHIVFLPHIAVSLKHAVPVLVMPGEAVAACRYTAVCDPTGEMPLSWSEYRVPPHSVCRAETVHTLQDLRPCRLHCSDGHPSSRPFPRGVNVPESSHVQQRLFDGSWLSNGRTGDKMDFFSSERVRSDRADSDGGLGDSQRALSLHWFLTHLLQSVNGPPSSQTGKHRPDGYLLWRQPLICTEDVFFFRELSRLQSLKRFPKPRH